MTRTRVRAATTMKSGMLNTVPATVPGPAPSAAPSPDAASSAPTAQVAELARLLARGYARLSGMLPASGRRVAPAPDTMPATRRPRGRRPQNPLDVPGDLRDGCAVVNARRTP